MSIILTIHLLMSIILVIHLFIKLGADYNRVPIVINSGSAQDSRRARQAQAPTARAQPRVYESSPSMTAFLCSLLPYAAFHFFYCHFIAYMRFRRDCHVPFWPSRCRPTEGTGWLPERTAEEGRPAMRRGYPEASLLL